MKLSLQCYSFAELYENFDRLDKNNDQVLSFDEFSPFLNNSPSAMDIFNMLNQDKSNRLSRDEIGRALILVHGEEKSAR